MSGSVARAALLLALLAPLAACVTPDELRQQDQATCAGYGFKPGTNDFANCLQRESLARRYGTLPWDAGPYGWSGPGWHPFP
ncbi:MAG TPA: hypothetical protein VE397_03805 [Stellaceae bacterium]|jgi:hypothetical protein|nr:hypothetical protein [Stellaceae bacterium]